MELLKGPDPGRRELVYQLLNGFIEPEAGKHQASKERMQIEPLIEAIYQGRLRLCARANLDFEDDAQQLSL